MNNRVCFLEEKKEEAKCAVILLFLILVGVVLLILIGVVIAEVIYPIGAFLVGEVGVYLIYERKIRKMNKARDLSLAFKRFGDYGIVKGRI